MEFLCELPNEAYIFVWLINGKTVQEIGPELLAERRIVFDYILVREDNRSFTEISIEPRVGNDNTRILCVANFWSSVPLSSDEVTFRIQGRQQLGLSVDCTTMFPISQVCWIHQLVWR